MASQSPTRQCPEAAEKVAIVGLGYVGLPLAVEFCKCGFDVVGLDVDERKISALGRGESYIDDVPSKIIAVHVSEGKLLPTTDWANIRTASAIILCVPTPLTKTRDPDMSYVVEAATQVAAQLCPGHLVILESTVYPGATEEVVAPALERGELHAGVDFALAFSPERIDPGNRAYKVADVPKIVGGITPECTEKAAGLYRRVFHNVIPMTAREAEMAKLLENTFRAVNIGLVNELAQVAHRMGINFWNVIDAAKTKPFGFMPFYPGPGLGGHCIPIDPTYLSWKAKAYHAETAFIDLADRVNGRMPDYVVERIGSLLNRHGKPLKDSKILLVGVAYKRDVADTRESPALDVLTLLVEKGCRVTYHDPHVPSLTHDGTAWKSVPLTAETLRDADCVVITTDHSACDWDLVVHCAPLVFDTRNATRSVRAERPQVEVL